MACHQPMRRLTWHLQAECRGVAPSASFSRDKAMTTLCEGLPLHVKLIQRATRAIGS
jgi:hypothetical protein